MGQADARKDLFQVRFWLVLLPQCWDKERLEALAEEDQSRRAVAAGSERHGHRLLRGRLCMATADKQPRTGTTEEQKRSAAVNNK